MASSFLDRWLRRCNRATAILARFHTGVIIIMRALQIGVARPFLHLAGFRDHFVIKWPKACNLDTIAFEVIRKRLEFKTGVICLGNDNVT